ncbi:Rv1733c family protein [Streptomyces albiaxialis]
MGEARAGRRRLWRWRRNALRRRTDVVEAWAVLLALALMVCGGAAGGWLVHGATTRLFEERRAEASPVGAVLLRDAPPAAWSNSGSTDNTVRGKVRWTARDGTRHTGHARVPAGERAGDRVTVWTDARGRIVREPPGPAESVTGAAMLAAVAVTLWCLLVLTVLALLRARWNRARLAAWDRAWSETGPRWTSGSGLT